MNPSERTPEFQGPPRPWLTGEEFSAHVQAYRIVRTQGQPLPNKSTAPRPPARLYQLNLDLKYEPRPKAANDPEASR